MKILRNKATGAEREYSETDYKTIMGNPITAQAFEDLGDVKKVEKSELTLLEKTKPKATGSDEKQIKQI